MNTYIQAMKKAMGDYYWAANDAMQKTMKARQIYQKDVAEEEASKYWNDLVNKKEDAIDAVVSAKDKGIAEAKRWGVLDGSKINDGDVKLLKYNLSPEQFESLVERYKNNGTMCFILRQYAEKQNREETTPGEYGMAGRLNPLIIPSVENKIRAYEFFAKSALSTIENIGGDGMSSVVVEHAVENFGTPNTMNYQHLEALGGV